MEHKRRRSSDDDDSTPSSDDSSVQRHHRDAGRQSQTRDYFSAHVASVCEEINAQAERSMSPFEQLMLQKRRETNRLSARRCRKRRRDEIKELEERQRQLQLETQQLTVENGELHAELHREIASASADNRPRAPTALPQRQMPQSTPFEQLQLLRSLMAQGLNPLSAQPFTQGATAFGQAHTTGSPVAALMPPPLAGLNVASLQDVQSPASHQGLASSLQPQSQAIPLDLLSSFVQQLQAPPTAVSAMPSSSQSQLRLSALQQLVGSLSQQAAHVEGNATNTSVAALLALLGSPHLAETTNLINNLNNQVAIQNLANILNQDPPERQSTEESNDRSGSS